MKSLSKSDLKKMLSGIFAVLGFSEEQIDKAVQDFQKRIAFDLLESVKGDLSPEYREFLDKESKNISDPNHPMVSALKKELKKLHSDKEYLEKSEVILKNLVIKYVDYLSRGLDADRAYKLKKALDNF